MKKYLTIALPLSLAAFLAACGEDPATNSNTANVVSSGSNAEKAGPTAAPISNPNDTPTEAYKRLFAAVKSKNTEAIKAEFSKNSIATAQAQASRSNVPVEEVFKNGMTGTTYAEKLPEIRDQRVKDNMGAIEVWNAKDKKWDDLPFIREESGWKLAVGDLFAGNWRSPGQGMAAKEQLAANAARGNTPTRVLRPANGNFNAPPMPAPPK